MAQAPQPPHKPAANQPPHKPGDKPTDRDKPTDKDREQTARDDRKASRGRRVQARPRSRFGIPTRARCPRSLEGSFSNPPTSGSRSIRSSRRRPTIGVKGEPIEDGERDPDTIAEEQRRALRRNASGRHRASGSTITIRARRRRRDRSSPQATGSLSRRVRTLSSKPPMEAEARRASRRDRGSKRWPTIRSAIAMAGPVICSEAAVMAAVRAP